MGSAACLAHHSSLLMADRARLMKSAVAAIAVGGEAGGEGEDGEVKGRERRRRSIGVIETDLQTLTYS